MTEQESQIPIRTTKGEVSKWGKSLTLQNAVQLIVIVSVIAGFYFKTNFRLDQQDANQKRTDEVLRYHNGWLTNLSIKTGVGPPVPESEN